MASPKFLREFSLEGFYWENFAAC